MTWDEKDGLRLYVNNRLLDHTLGRIYSQSNDPVLSDEATNFNNEFTLGKSDYAFDEFEEDVMTPDSAFGQGQMVSNMKNNFVDNQMVENNQTEDTDRLRKNLNKNYLNLNSNRNHHQLTNYYEFIIHKLVQFDVRKYPDEIITKDVIVQGKFFSKIFQ